MKSVRVLCRYAMQELFASKPNLLDYTRVISVNEPRGDKPALGNIVHPNLLVLHFDDLDLDYPYTEYTGAHIPFTADMAFAVVDFIRASEPFDELITHCHAGISRSGAIGTYACKYFKLKESLRQAKKDGIFPNKYMLKMLQYADETRQIKLYNVTLSDRHVSVYGKTKAEAGRQAQAEFPGLKVLKVQAVEQIEIK